MLPLFTKVYEQLKSKGLPFPDESKVNPLKDVGGSAASSSAPAQANVVTFKKPLDAKHRKLRKERGSALYKASTTVTSWCSTTWVAIASLCKNFAPVAATSI